jgi:uncharacterized protein YcbX
VPRVARLSIAPVRGLGLSHPASIDVSAMGVVNDRRFYLIDDHGRLVDRLRASQLCRVFAETDADATSLRMTFPDGRVVEGDVKLDEPVQTDIYNRLAIGHVVGGPWAAALEPFVGRPVLLVRCDRPGGTRIRAGESQVRNAVSLVSDGSLAELARELGVEAIDGRRFRMLIELEGAGAHEEDSWIGGSIEIGSAVLAITKPDARCAITTQDPDTGERDLDTLRTILRYRGFRADDPEHKIDFGVLGEVALPGRIALGDGVSVSNPSLFPPDVRDLIDELAGLGPVERERLERFARAFERIDAARYITFAEVPSAEDLEPAQAEAQRLLGSGSRHAAVKAAIGVFVDEAAQAYSRRPTLTDTFLMFRSLPDRAEDRVRFLNSVERTIVALILWDELTEQSRVALLGLWGSIAERVVAGGER